MSQTSFKVVLINSKNKVDLFHDIRLMVFLFAELMRKVIKAYACDCFSTSMSTSTWSY